MIRLLVPRLVALALLFSLGLGCAPTHAGRTLGKGILQVEGNLGGPFIQNLGGAFPVPNIPAGARYGITDRIDVATHLNLLALIMGGFMVMDAGATFAIIKHEGKNGPNLASQVGFALLTDFQEGARISPLVDIAGGYTWAWFTLFGGAEFAYDGWGNNMYGNFFIGAEADIGDFTLALSGTWFSPWFDAYSSAVDYVAPNNAGGIGLLLGFKYRFDLLRKHNQGGGS